MHYEHKNTLIDSEVNEILLLYKNYAYPYIYQYPGWIQIVSAEKKHCHFFGRENQELKIYAVVNEKFGIALLPFGPITNDIYLIPEFIAEIQKYYKRRHFGKLSIQLSIPTSQEAESIQYGLFQKIKFFQKYEIENWATLVLDLDKDMAQIRAAFSRGHKADINKAIKSNVTFREITEISEIESFGKLYDKLYKARHILKPFRKTNSVFVNIHSFFKENNLGNFYGTFDNNNQLLSGIIVVYQGDTALCYYGATDYYRKDLPIWHFLYFEIIKIAKEKGFRKFDFGGYNSVVKKSHQVFHINIFKRGFGGNIVYYPQLIHFRLNLFVYIFIIIARPIYLKLKLLLS